MKTTTRIADELAVPAALRPFAEVHLSGPRPITKVAELLAIPGLIAHIDVREIVACAVALRTAAPHDRLVWTLTAGVLDRRVPNWHWDMVSDKRRNEVYDVAAKALIEPGMTVLEIGTGTGILAIIAARAGAKHVYTIEMNPRMAHVARASIAKNGYADRITVIESDALNVSVGDQLPHRADAMIHEIISTNVVSENVLELIGHAKEALLVPDPLLLPDEVWAMGQLGAREPQYPLNDVSGRPEPARFDGGHRAPREASEARSDTWPPRKIVRDRSERSAAKPKSKLPSYPGRRHQWNSDRCGAMAELSVSRWDGL
ncbi:MAG: 50S ribosomal protein L11 methyltransferase [Pseudomonadota bacterium]